MALNIVYKEVKGLGVIYVRKILGIKQKELAVSLGTSVPFLSRVENGKTEISVDFALRFCYYIDKVLNNENISANLNKSATSEITRYINSLKEDVIDKEITI